MSVIRTQKGRRKYYWRVCSDFDQKFHPSWETHSKWFPHLSTGVGPCCACPLVSGTKGRNSGTKGLEDPLEGSSRLRIYESNINHTTEWELGTLGVLGSPNVLTTEFSQPASQGPVFLIYLLFKVTLWEVTCYPGAIEKAKGTMTFPGTGPVKGSWLERWHLERVLCNSTPTMGTVVMQMSVMWYFFLK